MRRLPEPKCGTPKQNKKGAPERKTWRPRNITRVVASVLGVQTGTYAAQYNFRLLPDQNIADVPPIATKIPNRLKRGF